MKSILAALLLTTSGMPALAASGNASALPPVPATVPAVPVGISCPPGTVAPAGYVCVTPVAPVPAPAPAPAPDNGANVITEILQVLPGILNDTGVIDSGRDRDRDYDYDDYDRYDRDEETTFREVMYSTIRKQCESKVVVTQASLLIAVNREMDRLRGRNRDIKDVWDDMSSKEKRYEVKKFAREIGTGGCK